MANKEHLERQLSRRAISLEKRLATIKASQPSKQPLAADELIISELPPQSASESAAAHTEKACREELEQIRQKIQRLQHGHYPACQICEDVITFEDQPVSMHPGYCGACADEINFVQDSGRSSRLKFSLAAIGISVLVILIILIW